MVAVAKFGPRQFGFVPSGVEVRDKSGALATLYDSTGTTATPASIDPATGAVTFFAPPGQYRLKALRTSTDTEPTVASFTLETTGVPGAGDTVGHTGRATATYTSASLAANATATGTITLAPGYRLYRLATNRPARVRIYDSVAKRDADVARAIGTAPTGEHGLMLEYTTEAGKLSGSLNPLVDGYDAEATPTGAIPITVTNLDTVAGAVTVNLTYVRTE